MATFFDDFERANGGAGSNWSNIGGTLNISGGYAVASGGTFAYANQLSDSGRQEARITAGYVDDGSFHAAVGVKVSAYDGYWAYLTWSSGTLYLVIGKGYILTWPSTVTQSIGTSKPFWWSLSIVYDQGVITASYNDGAVTATLNDIQYAGNSLSCIAVENDKGRIGEYRGVMGQAGVDLTISPNPVGNYGTATAMTASGTGTAWTAGTPGSPALSVTEGTISNQTVVDADTMTFDYDPGTYLGMVRFTDPTTGAYDDVLVTSDVQVVPPGGGYLSSTAIAYIERSAIAETNPTIANREMVISESGPSIDLSSGINRIRLSVADKTYTESGDNGTLNMLFLLWQIVNGSVAAPVGPFPDLPDEPLHNTLATLAASFAAFRDPPTYTVQDIMDNLRGTGNYNHSDIMTAIGNVSGGDNQEVLDAIAAMQGDPLATIKAVLDLVFLLGTVNNYNLGDVKTWIETARGTDLPTIRDVLNKLGTSGNTIEARIDALSDLIVTETTLQGMLDILLTAITGGVGITIASATDDIIAAINGIQVQAAPGAPTWPGLGNVTLGTEVALADDLEITGPMHGLLFTITGYPPGAGKYVFGTVDSWQHTGGVIFCTDRGDYERAMSFGLERQIVVPQTMQVAASAIVRLNSGWSGTVRPWSRTV